MPPHASSDLDQLFASACTPAPLAPPPSTPASAAATLVLYHWPCFDGAGAALAAWLHLAPLGRGHDGAPGPLFIPHPVTRDLDPLALPVNPASTVYLLDYAGPPGFAAALAARAGRVVVLDHHKTAAEELGKAAGGGGDSKAPPNLEILLDRRRSGAGLAAAHFFPPGGSSGTMPPNVARLLAAIEDGDLWVWEKPDSKAIYAGLGATPGLQLDAGGGSSPGAVSPDRATAVAAAATVFGRLAALDIDALASTGTALLAEQEAAVGAAAASAVPMQLGGPGGKARGWGRALGVTVTPALSAHRSALGNELASRAAARAGAEPGAGWVPVGVVAYRDPNQAPGDRRVKVSLRSVGPDADTTVVTKHYGGGGHFNASSCMVEEERFEAWRKSE